MNTQTQLPELHGAMTHHVRALIAQIDRISPETRSDSYDGIDIRSAEETLWKYDALLARLMAGTNETPVLTEAFPPTDIGESTTPDGAPKRLRGPCPKCGDTLVSNCYYRSGRGHTIAWDCEECGFRKTL